MTFDIARAVREVDMLGFCVFEDILSPQFVKDARDAMYRAQTRIEREVGSGRLARAGERGTLRLLLKFDPIFLKFLEVSELLQWVDIVLGNTAILHTQNGFILPSDREALPDIFQHRFHKDFPRHLNGYVASTNVMFAIDPYTKETGATTAIPGSHQRGVDFNAMLPSITGCSVAIEADPGAMILFDSTLWHAAGANTSGLDRVSINHQFTRSWIKPQIDYVRALGNDMMAKLPERTQQILGWHTRTVTSLDEYYRPEEDRLYRRGQG